MQSWRIRAVACDTNPVLPALMSFSANTWVQVAFLTVGRSYGM